MEFPEIGRGLVLIGNHNPFAVKPSFHLWAPWIGQNTRKSVSVLNTEWEKVHSSNPNSASEIPVTEERLTDELMTEGRCCPSVMWILRIKYQGIKDGPHNETKE